MDSRLAKTVAVGILERLWTWAGDYAMDGALGQFPARLIADAVGWVDDADWLLEALCAPMVEGGSGYIDRHPTAGLVIHAWPEHCEDNVHRAMARTGRRFADGTTPKLTKLDSAERVRAQEIYRLGAVPAGVGSNPAPNGRSAAPNGGPTTTTAFTTTTSPPKPPPRGGAGRPMRRRSGTAPPSRLPDFIDQATDDPSVMRRTWTDDNRTEYIDADTGEPVVFTDDRGPPAAAARG